MTAARVTLFFSGIAVLVCSVLLIGAMFGPRRDAAAYAVAELSTFDPSLPPTTLKGQLAELAAMHALFAHTHSRDERIQLLRESEALVADALDTLRALRLSLPNLEPGRASMRTPTAGEIDSISDLAELVDGITQLDRDRAAAAEVIGTD